MRIFKKRHKSSITEIKYFHPTGKMLPNGSFYQKGGFLKECQINCNSFILSEDICDTQNGKKDNRGGVIVFSTDVNAAALNDYVRIYSLGNYFKGKYVGDNGETFNDKSLALKISGLSSKGLLRLSEHISTEILHEHILVKDFNTNKIYLVSCPESLEN